MAAAGSRHSNRLEPARQMGAGPGIGIGQGAWRQAPAEAPASEDRDRGGDVRSVVNEMLRDGSLVRGLTVALEHQQQNQKSAPDVPKRLDVREREAYGQLERPDFRYNQFLGTLDLEADAVMNLIGRCEVRLGFLIHDGPPALVATTAPTPTLPEEPPLNALEGALLDATRRVAAIRLRLEALHDVLRT